MSEYKLFSKKDDCCGCGACISVCPHQAIHMEEDEFGFWYPKIDNDICVACGLCRKKCGYQREIKTLDIKKAYAAFSKNESFIMNAASGGVFGTLASTVLREDGVVVGAAYIFSDDSIKIKHIAVDNIRDLEKLQGSKYVQSNTGDIFPIVKRKLLAGKKVLFSGTPCQVAVLRSYLDKEYENLILVDVVCHGVPSQKLLAQYFGYIEQKYHGTINYFNFRDKNKGWENYAIQVHLRTSNGRQIKKSIHCRNSGYYDLFLNASICRDSCYSCKYAGEKRCGDITIGDYWGIRNAHPELINRRDWLLLQKKGISCVLVNSSKGMDLLQTASPELELFESDYNRVARENGQLRHPSKRPENREYVMGCFENYADLEAQLKKKFGLRWYLFWVKNNLPSSIRYLIQILKRGCTRVKW